MMTPQKAAEIGNYIVLEINKDFDEFTQNSAYVKAWPSRMTKAIRSVSVDELRLVGLYTQGGDQNDYFEMLDFFMLTENQQKRFAIDALVADTEKQRNGNLSFRDTKRFQYFLSILNGYEMKEYEEKLLAIERKKTLFSLFIEEARKTGSEQEMNELMEMINNPRSTISMKVDQLVAAWPGHGKEKMTELFLTTFV